MNEDSTLYTELTNVNKRRGISGSTLKLIAIITMIIDHTGATIVQKMLMINADNGLLFGMYTVMRSIGRISFPIFCFLLVEGYLHTRNVRKYAVRLAIFAIISDIPFDLALHNTPFNFGYQNVYFTLLIGLLTLIGFRTLKEKAEVKNWLPVTAVLGAVALGGYIAYKTNELIYFNTILSTVGSTVGVPTRSVMIFTAIIFSIIALIVYTDICKTQSLQQASLCFTDLLVLVVGMLLADMLRTDYSGFGVLTMAVIYGLRMSNFKGMLGACITLTIMNFSEITCFVALIPTFFYNGKRGLNLKYLFYSFYPAHLFIFYLICYALRLT